MDQVLVFGLRDLPRPRGEGFLYYRFVSNKSMRTLVDLDLYNSTDKGKVKLVFAEGIRRFIKREELDDQSARKLLRNYKLENMQPWSEELFSYVVAAVINELNADQSG